MTKLKLNPSPTFESVVDIPLHGGGSVPVKFRFKHCTRAALKEFIETVKDRADIDNVLEMASGWDLVDEFNRENLSMLLENYSGAGREIFNKYVDEITQSRIKN